MKIKRFIAPDMRSAFRMVREEQGPDAVILSNRHVEGGVEIVAATDYDESLVQQALVKQATRATPAAVPTTAVVPTANDSTIAPSAGRQSPAAGSRTPGRAHFPLPDDTTEFPLTATAPHADARPTPARALAADPAASPAVIAAVAAAPSVQALWNEDPNLVEVRQELVSMRRMIEAEMGRLTDQRLRGAPVRATALDALAGYGCDEILARAVALKIPADTEESRGRGLMLGQLAKMLPIATDDVVDGGGVLALIGPTGAGKTTTVAKLAARYAARHGARDVALVTTDTFRIGGREQLHTYGRLLGITVHEADSETSLAQVLEKLHDYKLVLIDTAGLGQRDKALVGQIGWLRAARRVRSLLVMPANAQATDLDEVIRRFRGAAPEAVVLTKLDETGRLGGALSVLIRHGLPLAYTTDGQRVPEDIQRAQAPHVVLRLDELRRAADRPTIAEDSHAVA